VDSLGHVAIRKYSAVKSHHISVQKSYFLRIVEGLSLQESPNLLIVGIVQEFEKLLLEFIFCVSDGSLVDLSVRPQVLNLLPEPLQATTPISHVGEFISSVRVVLGHARVVTSLVE